MRLKIHLHSTCRAKKNLFIWKQKEKIHSLGVVINLFLVVKPSSSDVERTFLFGCSYIASGNSLFVFSFN